MRDFETYIFDLDGTLLYTLGDLTNSLNYAMGEFGYPKYSTEEVKLMVGNGIKKLIERAIPHGTNNPQYINVYSVFMEHYLKHNLDTTKPYDGIIEMIDKLKKHGKKLAVVSNKYCKATEELCRHFFSDYISVVIGQSDSVRKKPAPDSVFEAIRRLDADKTKCVYIGDSEVDIETAKNSGLPCISVLWGFRDKDFLQEHGAETFIEHPNELIKNLDNK